MPAMDSINNNQPELNHQDLSGAAAIDRIKTLVGKAKACFFCTEAGRDRSAAPLAGPHGELSNWARPMNVRKVDDDGTLWFLSASDSHKNHEVAANPEVTLYFQGSPHSDFLQLSGRAELSRDPAKIKELWEPILRTWFTGGIDDPRITVIRFTPTAGYYWDTKHGNVIAGVKMMIGAMVGQTLDDSIEGRISV